MENTHAHVLSTTIDKYLYVVVKERFDDKIRLNYSTTETVDNLLDLNHELARWALKFSQIFSGIEISTMGDIPEGSGLGSSSAVTVGLLNALQTKIGIALDKEKLASYAIHIENNLLRKPMGIQDQVAVAYGGFNEIGFHRYSPNFTVFDPEIPKDTLTKLNNNLLLFYTGNTRFTSDILREQKMNTASQSILISELVSLCKDAISSLKIGKLNNFGNLLHKSWELKKKLNPKTTNPNIDDLYNYGLTNGALGGKILGAGGGGYMLFYVPQEKQAELKHAMNIKKILELPFRFEKNGSKIIFNNE